MSTPLCRECSDAAGAHWRRWAELALGDAPTVRALTDQDLRRAIKQRLDARAHADTLRVPHSRPQEKVATCTPITARWCPICGTCKCRGDGLGDDLNNSACPLHAPESPHGEPFEEEIHVRAAVDTCPFKDAITCVPVDPAEVERVLAELHVARKFTRAFWPEGLITRALVGCTYSLKLGEYTPAQIEDIAVGMLESCTGMSRTGEEMPHA